MEFAYDGFGRIVKSVQTTPNGGTAYSFGTPTANGYQDSLTDQLTNVIYPSGRSVAYTLDAADQVTSVSGTPPGRSGPPNTGHAQVVVGLDYFGARYFSGAQGMFASPGLAIVASTASKSTDG
jgi:hypothetical protein